VGRRPIGGWSTALTGRRAPSIQLLEEARGVEVAPQAVPLDERNFTSAR
jgi:hypothetical protein